MRGRRGDYSGPWLRTLTRLLGACLFLAAVSNPQLQAAGRPARPVAVGYFPQWGVYTQYFVKNLVAEGGAARLDQINYAQGVIAQNRCAIADPNADLNLVYTGANSVDGKADDPAAPLRGNFHQLQELRKRFPKLKILISLEGKPDGFAAAAMPENRAAFVSSCIEMFLRGHVAPGVEVGRIFDGFDIDWEYPRAADNDNYVALLAEFRTQMKRVRRGLRLTVATGAGIGHYQGLDMRAVSKQVDQVGVMNYDYNGPWNRRTGILAPLYAIPGDPLSGNVDKTFQDYEKAGVSAEKLLMGIPFYAYGWDGVPDVNHGLFQSGQTIQGDHFYSYIQSIQSKFTLYRDPNSQAPWLYDGHAFWTFEDQLSVHAKLDYVRRRKLAGVMVWELSNDSADGLLLKTISTELRGPGR